MQFSLKAETKAKIYKIAKGAALAGLGAAMISAAQAMMNADFGSWTPWLQAFATILLNTAKVLSKI